MLHPARRRPDPRAAPCQRAASDHRAARPGDICGLASLLDGRADHDTVALSAVSCLPVTRRWLTTIAAGSIDLSHALWRELARELAISTAWIVNLGQRSAYDRLVFFLCELEARLRAAGHDTSAGFEFPGTQADISAITGLSLVHVNRTLNRLRAAGLRSGGHRLRFQNPDKLRAVVDFDSSYLALEGRALGEMLLSRIGDFDAARRHATARASQLQSAAH